MRVALLRPGAYFVAFWCLYRLMVRYEHAEVVLKSSVCWIRRIGYTLIAIDVVALIQSALTGLMLTYLGRTQGYFALHIGSSYFVVGVFIVFIGHIMDLGRELKEEHDLVI